MPSGHGDFTSDAARLAISSFADRGVGFWWLSDVSLLRRCRKTPTAGRFWGLRIKSVPIGASLLSLRRCLCDAAFLPHLFLPLSNPLCIPGEAAGSRSSRRLAVLSGRQEQTRGGGQRRGCRSPRSCICCVVAAGSFKTILKTTSCLTWPVEPPAILLLVHLYP